MTREDTSRRRPLRIAMLAPPWIAVPPPAYGGIEHVVALLTEALVARGHRVELFCAPGSTSSAAVHPLLPGQHPESIERALFEADHVARAFDAVDVAAESSDPFDVIHDHCGFTALAMARRLQTPLVHTVHGPFDDDDAREFYGRHGTKGVIACLSEAQASDAPPELHVKGVVPNPIDLERWPLREHERSYLLWIGRMNPVKGPQAAIRVARAAGLPLVLAGPVQPGFEAFFAEEVEPHVDGGQIRYVGEVGGTDKEIFYAGAHALLMPITWPEPFGMVMIEALASGTPVLAFPRGAAPEIVRHGETGFLVDGEDEMARAVARAGTLDPAACRASVAGRWTPDRVAEGYEEIYRAAMFA